MNAALLINLLGFAVGTALYAMIGAMVVRHGSSQRSTKGLLLTTAGLGLLWNLGELYAFVQNDFADTPSSPLLAALSFSALGFLPSVVVHSARSDKGRHWLTIAAYTLSSAAMLLHLRAAALGQQVPSDLALQTLTFGSLALSAALLLFAFRQTVDRKALLASCLLIFAVSTLHLGGGRESSSWVVELAAHQSSLPLALVILFQNYRFAFADLFLKRAISLLLLATVALAQYVFVAVPLLRYHETHDRDDVQAAALIIGLWILTALMYPAISALAVMFVDKVLLARGNYERIQLDLATEVESCESVDAVLDLIAKRLGSALTARKVVWQERSGDGKLALLPLVQFSPEQAAVAIPTAEAPSFELIMTQFFGGRRLLSEEISLLEAVSRITARRIDALRLSQARYEQRYREQEFARETTEAQLTALRAQINPHFLFNALTTIGYLIKASPDKAFTTLLRLTQLLRGVLRSTGEFSSLGDEIKLIESYLDIERARFEEKLKVTIDVPDDVRNIKVPSLILQPVVENAVKHGISENRGGGEVSIKACLKEIGPDTFLRLHVCDSGAEDPGRRPQTAGGTGLRNIESRLHNLYGDKAYFELNIAGPNGTEAIVELPVTMLQTRDVESSVVGEKR